MVKELRVSTFQVFPVWYGELEDVGIRESEDGVLGSWRGWFIGDLG